MAIWGVSSETGKPITGDDLLTEKIKNILWTPKGSLCLNREYGSNLFNMIDRAPSDLEIAAEVNTALTRFAPEYLVKRVQILRDLDSVKIKIHFQNLTITI